MRIRTTWLGAGLLVVMPALVAVAQATEVELDKVPAPVQETLKTRFEKNTVRAAAKEKTPEGADIYEINMEDPNKNNVDVMVTPEGQLTLIEQQIGRKDLPEAITKTLESKYPKAKYRLVEAVVTVQDKEEKLTHYEVLLITAQKQIRVVELALDGKITKEEKRLTEEQD